MIEIPVRLLRDLSISAESIMVVGKYIGLTEEECKHPKAGEWIVEELKNIDTASLLRMQLNLKQRIKSDNIRNPLIVVSTFLKGRVDNNNNEE